MSNTYNALIHAKQDGTGEEVANNLSGGGGGHEIINASGTSMTQRTGLQFKGLDVSDDSVNGRTVVSAESLKNEADATRDAGAVNLLNSSASSKSEAGLVYTVNSDKSILVTYGDGTSAGSPSANTNITIALKDGIVLEEGVDYILSGAPEGGGSTTWLMAYTNNVDYQYNDTGDGVTIRKFNDTSYPNQYIYITIISTATIPAGGLLFKPMISDARLNLSYNDFVPYAPTNRELMSYKANGKVGAKNLLPYPYYETTKTQNGITFTDNGDGTVNISGTASTNSAFSCAEPWVTKLKKGTYRLSMQGTDSRINYYFMSKTNPLDQDLTNYVLTDKESVITLSVDSVIYFAIYVNDGSVISTPVTVKPMIRIAEDTDDTFVPYAMTNRQLTESVGELGFKKILYVQLNATNVSANTITEIPITVSEGQVVGGVVSAVSAAGTSDNFTSNAQFLVVNGQPKVYLVTSVTGYYLVHCIVFVN